jgi:hypothetical protein
VVSQLRQDLTIPRENVFTARPIAQQCGVRSRGIIMEGPYLAPRAVLSKNVQKIDCVAAVRTDDGASSRVKSVDVAHLDILL